MKKKITLRTIKPYLFLIPIFSLLIIFKYIPFGMAIEKSFFNWNGANMITKKQKLSRARQKRRAKQRRITKKQKRKILMRQTRRSQM